MSSSKLLDLFKLIESGEHPEQILYDELEQGIPNGTYKILELVENLGILLIHKETAMRKKGVEILSKYLSMLDKNYLNERELEFIVAFYCDRLKDHHSVIPEVLLGIDQLCDMKQLPEDAYMKLFPVVFLHFNCQSQVVQDRKIFFNILFKCMKHNFEGLKPMGPDFVYGVIQSIDGERDPRNLIFLFTTLIPLFLNNFELYHLHEEMFDIMACYFPIDFRPKEHDPDAIHREDLANALMPNLIAKLGFADLCIPLALEKLESDLKVAKLDSLILLTHACYKFSNEKISDNSKKIWNAVKNDLNTDDTDMKEKQTGLLHAMLTVLPDEEAAGLFQVIYNHVKYSLSTNIDKSLFVSNTKLLIAISKDSKVCMKQVAILLVPIMYIEINKTYNDEFIQVLNNILEICSKNLEIQLSELNELSVTWKDLIDLYLKLCITSDAALYGLNTLHFYLDSNQRTRLYNVLNDGFKSKRVSSEFQECFCTFAKFHKDEIFENIISPMKNEIIEKSDLSKNKSNPNDIKKEILENMKQNNPDVYTKDEPETGYMKPFAYRKNEENEEVPIFLAICPPARCETAEDIYIKHVYCPLIRLDSYLKDLSTDVIGFCLLENSSDSCFKFCSSSYESNVSLLKYIVVENENRNDVLDYFETEFNVCEKVVKIFLDNVSDESYSMPFVLDCIAILNIILGAQSKTCINKKVPKLFENIITMKDIKLIILIPLLTKIDFKNEVIVKNLEQLSYLLLEIAISTKDSFINKHASILLSIILNNIEYLESSQSGLNITSFQSKVLSIPYDSNVSTLHAYITKALITKGYMEIDPWLQVLVDGLKNYKMGRNVVESLKIIIHKDTVKQDCFELKNVKFLYRQRLFMFCLKNLLNNVSDANGSESDKESLCAENKIIKLNNYLAILIQLKLLSNQIIVSHIKTLLPVMIECLTLICDTQLGGKNTWTKPLNENNLDTIAKEESLDTQNELVSYSNTIDFDDALENLLSLFAEFLKTKFEVLHEYVNSFVDKFLFVAQNHFRLNHRIAALQCLYYLSFFDVIKLVPFKNKVIEGIKLILDDHKRLVRKQAVTTIDRWYVLDSADDDN